MAVFPTVVRTIVNGQAVDASTTDGPIADLTNRTDWLKAQLAALEAGTNLILRSQTVEAGVIDGTPVYLDVTDDTFKPALTEIDQTNLNLAGSRSFWQGVATNVVGTAADIVIGGSCSLTALTWASVYEDGVFAAGDVFLSGTTAGKITTTVTTAGIYVGHMRASGELLVRMTNGGAFSEHVHLARTLVGDPADSAPADPALGVDQTLVTPDASLQGWLPANATYFPGYVVGVQIPTGSVFGYNIQHASETALREVFPVIPEDNAQFAQAGLVLSTDLVVINNYGIWWMDDSYGNAPWPVDYVASGGLANDITLWTSRPIAESSMFDSIYNLVVSQLAAGGSDSFAVSTINTADPSSLSITATEGDALNGYRGQAVLANLGVTGLRYGRGLTASGTSGDNTTGLKGLLDVRVALDLQAEHLWTELTAGGDKLVPVTTNGVSAGATIGLRGHRLGSNAADFIDFTAVAGRDLLSTVVYKPSVVILAAVDTALGTVTAKNVDVDFYVLTAGSPLSTSQFARTVQASFNEGEPGKLQTVTLGPYADVVVEAGDILLVRIRLNAGGNPLTGDTLRVLDVRYRLDQ